jgi:hypothetical protein
VAGLFLVVSVLPGAIRAAANSSCRDFILPAVQAADRRSRRDVTAITIIIATAIARDEVIRPIPSPPSSRGFVNVSPSVAPSGRVKT